MQLPYRSAHEFPLILAPMAGVSEAPFRQICRRMGADVVLSESPEERGILFRALNVAAKFRAGKPELPGHEKTTFQVVLLCPPEARREILHGLRAS